MSVKPFEPKFKPLYRIPEDQDRQLKAVSKDYEKYFLQEMMRAMRKSVDESDLLQKNLGAKIYGEQLDQEYVNSWSEAGGIGLSEIIYQNVRDKIFPQAIDRPAKGQMLPLNENHIQRAIPLQNTEEQSTIKFELKDKEGSEPLSLHLPRGGKLVGQKSLDSLMQLDFQHENGTSHFVFKGTPLNAVSNRDFSPGEKIATLSPESKELHWILRKS